MRYAVLLLVALAVTLAARADEPKPCCIVMPLGVVCYSPEYKHPKRPMCLDEA